jgi:hypothetical protein
MGFTGLGGECGFEGQGKWRCIVVIVSSFLCTYREDEQWCVVGFSISSQWSA